MAHITLPEGLPGIRRTDGVPGRRTARPLKRAGRGAAARRGSTLSLRGARMIAAHVPSAQRGASPTARPAHAAMIAAHYLLADEEVALRDGHAQDPEPLQTCSPELKALLAIAGWSRWADVERPRGHVARARTGGGRHRPGDPRHRPDRWPRSACSTATWTGSRPGPRPIRTSYRQRAAGIARTAFTPACRPGWPRWAAQGASTAHAQPPVDRNAGRDHRQARERLPGQQAIGISSSRAHRATKIAGITRRSGVRRQCRAAAIGRGRPRWPR